MHVPRGMLGELNHDQVEQFLHQEVIGRIGCHHEGRTYVVPVTYAYDGEAVYAHSAEGLKLSMMRANPEVCFEVDHLQDLGNWQSVIARGRFEELEGPAAEQGLQKLFARVQPLMPADTGGPAHGSMDHRAATGMKALHIFRIVLRERTGRFEQR